MAALNDDSRNTLIISWVFTWLAEGLMAVRLIMRKVRRRRQKFDLSDHFTMVAMACLIIRLALVHVVLLWGTNNITTAYRATHVFSDEELYEREVASKLTLVVRVDYNTYSWLQKAVVMFLYKTMFSNLPWMDTTVNIYWGILIVTYIVSQITVFTDCRPFSLYWQVVPDPGSCVQALTQLIVLGLLTIITDVMLIVLPMPTLFRVKRTLIQKFQLIVLFSVGFVLVAMTIVRLTQNFSTSGVQVNRTMWASIEAFAAAFVANTPTLYTLRKRPQRVVSELSRQRTSSTVIGAERQGITVTRSIELREAKESPTVPPNAIVRRYNDPWDKDTSQEDLIYPLNHITKS